MSIGFSRFSAEVGAGASGGDIFEQKKPESTVWRQLEAGNVFGLDVVDCPGPSGMCGVLRVVQMWLHAAKCGWGDQRTFLGNPSCKRHK